MKKLAAIASTLFFLLSTCDAQSFDTTQYYGKMNYVFQYVDKNQISTGLLRDYGIEFVNLDNYQGTTLHDSNYVSMDDWRLLYTSLFSSQINNNASMLYLDTVNRLINKYNYTSMPITFIGLDYNYNNLKDDAITSNLMYVNNDHLYDVNGRTQSPYEAKELFAVAPIRQAGLTGNNQFIFRPELFLSNTGKTISSIAYDASGGSNYQTVAFNTPFTVNYNTSGFYDFSIRITYNDNSTRYTHTKMVIYKDPNGNSARYGVRPTINQTVAATKAYQNVFGSGDITLDLASSNATGQIRKPLIVVEGFDPDGGFTYHNEIVPRISFDVNFGFPNYFLHGITLNDGLDNTDEYDLIYLHFQNGTDYIQRNAFLLERVIQIVNQSKIDFNGARQQNVIIGMSMGGLITRYALRDMEINGQNHETRLFISHDSPHWGANVPVGAQVAVQHLAPWKIININGSFPFINWVDMFPQATDALNLFNSPAAKQMLIQRFTLSGQTLTADNSSHVSFLNEIDQMGWPINCRNINLSNGACDGTKIFADNSTMFAIDGNRDMRYLGSLWRTLVMTISGGTLNYGGLINGWNSPQFNAWAELWQFPLSIISTKNSIGVDFKIRAVPISGTQEIYRGDVFSKKKVLGLINVKNYFISTHINSTTSMLPLDNAPGGKYDVNGFGLDPNIITAGLPDFFQGYIQALTLQPQFCFVPTVSSLAISNPEANLFTNLCSNADCLSSASVQDYFAPQHNELHISYTQGSSDWILQRQDPNFNCVKTCSSNLSISGDNTVCTTSNNYTIAGLPVGATVAWTAAPSNIVTVNSPNAVQTTLSRLTSGTITLTATITNACNGNAILTKQNVSVGAPSAVLIQSMNNLNVCDDDNTSFQILASGGGSYSYQGTLTATSDYGLATNYVWTLVSGTSNLAWSANGATVTVSAKSYSMATLSLKCIASNSCGSTVKYFYFSPICSVAPKTSRNSDEVNSLFQEFSVYPNPAKNLVTVLLPTDTEIRKTSIVIKDVDGRILKTLSPVSHSNSISISNLAAGVYLFEIHNGQKIIFVKKIMKN